jgi:hypothetical protein
MRFKTTEMKSISTRPHSLHHLYFITKYRYIEPVDLCLDCLFSYKSRRCRSNQSNAVPDPGIIWVRNHRDSVEEKGAKIVPFCSFFSMLGKILNSCPHCTVKFKTYIPRNEIAQPRYQFKYSYIWEPFIYNPTIGLIWNLYFPVLCERTLGSTAGAERRAGNCH